MDTSKIAYGELRETGRQKTLQEMFLDALKGKILTANEVAALCSENPIERESIRKRVSELKKKALVVQVGTGMCAVTGKKCKTWALALDL